MSESILKLENAKAWKDSQGLWHHICSDGKEYVWEPRKKSPKSCPRCKQRLDTPYKPLK